MALFAGLAPQERAAVVLKDGLGLSLAEIAEILETTTGAVKSTASWQPPMRSTSLC